MPSQTQLARTAAGHASVEGQRVDTRGPDPSRRLRRFILTGLLVLGAVAVARAQTNTGEIAGLVKDGSGGVLPAVAVTARHPTTGTVVTRVTDKEGRFFLPALRIGQWDVTAVLTGFTPQTQRIVLEVGRTLAVDITLGVGLVVENVTVEPRTTLLQTRTAEISDVIENREVVQLPLNGRNFLALAQLSDTVVLPPGGTRGEALQQAGPLPNVGGQRSGHNIYLLDGSKVTDELFNNLVISPSVDSIEEFKIQKSQYPAEFGGKASALINVVTKAGSNALRGSLFEFHRNDAFDAPNYFHPTGEPLPPLRQNQFGGALGGPLRRDRTFFFGSYEGHPPGAVADPDVLGADTGGSRRRLRRLGPDLRSADHSRHRRLRAVCRQPHSGQDASIRSPRRCSSRCRCRRPTPRCRT